MMLFSFPRRGAHCFGATFILVMVWKFILLLLTAQPIPANDAFGYDGAVVNYLLHGHYCNPALMVAFPFSGTHIYSIYPPLYQAVLYPWMAVFGTSILAAMWFHFVLFGLYGLTLLGIFRQLGTPAWAVNLAGLFWFGITFDDRPDSLAQLLGMVAVYAWVRSVAESKVTRGSVGGEMPHAKTGKASRWVRDTIECLQGFLRCCLRTKPDFLKNMVICPHHPSVWALPPHPGPLPRGEGEWPSVSQPHQSPTLADAGSGDPAYKATCPGSSALKSDWQLGGVCARDGRAPGISLWSWVAALAVVLGGCANPELGALYFGWIWLLMLGAAWMRQARIPIGPMAFMCVAPVALVAFVKFGRPDLWAGFLEHAGQTPSITPWRLPSMGDLLKVGRSIPAILLIAALVVWRGRSGGFAAWRASLEAKEVRPLLLLGTGLLITVGLVAGGLTRFTANWILYLLHWQPLLVGIFLAATVRPNASLRRWLTLGLAVLVLVVSVRAIGLSTWGVACALDRSEAEAQGIVRTALEHTPMDATVVMSTAYLYDAQQVEGRRYIHEDWTHRADAPAGKLSGDAAGLLKLKPAALILTQFDYCRRYQAPLAELRALPAVVSLETTNYARVRAPDSYPRFQQVVQQVAWAPVVVTFAWKQAGTPGGE